MNRKPIIIIDDDDEDLDFLKDAFAQLNVQNEILVFNDGLKFIDFMQSSDGSFFFILCDVSMARIGGLDLKKRIFDDDRLRLKCMPFIFLSSSRASKEVMKAYSYGVQGFFVKPNNFEKLKELVQSIIQYWSQSERPNP